MTGEERRGRQGEADRLTAASLAAGEPTGWFDRLYGAAAAGEVEVPWDRRDPRSRRPLRRGPAAPRRRRRLRAGRRRRAPGQAGLRHHRVRRPPSAVRLAQERFPDSAVHYATADLLHLPGSWRGAFDLVVDVFTVQALPDPPRADAVRAVAGLVAPGGTLLVVASAREEDEQPVAPPPWPLTRSEVEGFATGGLAVVRMDDVDAAHPGARRWRVELHRPR